MPNLRLSGLVVDFTLNMNELTLHFLVSVTYGPIRLVALFLAQFYLNIKQIRAFF